MCVCVRVCVYIFNPVKMDELLLNNIHAEYYTIRVSDVSANVSLQPKSSTALKTTIAPYQLYPCCDTRTAVSTTLYRDGRIVYRVWSLRASAGSPRL